MHVEVEERRVLEIREANKLEEANALLEEGGWDLFAALPMEGPASRSGSGFRYVRYVLVRRSIDVRLGGV